MVYLKKLFQCLGKTVVIVVTGSTKIEGWVPAEYMFHLSVPHGGWSLHFMQIQRLALCIYAVLKKYATDLEDVYSLRMHPACLAFIPVGKISLDLCKI